MDRTEAPATIGVLLSAAADDASLALTLDWGRTLLTHLHSAPWHEGELWVHGLDVCDMTAAWSLAMLQLPCTHAAVRRHTSA